MELFNKLPGFTPSPPGLERIVLRLLPPTMLWGTLLLALALLVLRLIGAESPQAPLGMGEIYVLGLMPFYWSVLLVVALAAFIVMVMKGPAYVADAYPLPDADDED